MKAILMLSEMPESCKDCILCNDNWWCVADDDPTDDKTRPNWCPLIEINDNIARLIEVAR